MSGSRKAIVRFVHEGTPIEVEVHPEDVGVALDSVKDTLRRMQRRARRQAPQALPDVPPTGAPDEPGYLGPSTETIREFLRSHPDANVHDVGQALMGGQVINAQKNKWLYDAVYIRLFTARKQLKQESETVGTVSSLMDTGKRSKAAITPDASVKAITTTAAVEFVRANPKATMKEFARDLVGMELRLSGPTKKAYRLASNKLWYARKKLGIPSPSVTGGG
jgi:hypothetical protein